MLGVASSDDEDDGDVSLLGGRRTPVTPIDAAPLLASTSKSFGAAAPASASGVIGDVNAPLSSSSSVAQQQQRWFSSRPPPAPSPANSSNSSSKNAVASEGRLGSFLRAFKPNRVAETPVIRDFDPEELTAQKREWVRRRRGSSEGGTRKLFGSENGSVDGGSAAAGGEGASGEGDGDDDDADSSQRRTEGARGARRVPSAAGSRGGNGNAASDLPPSSDQQRRQRQRQQQRQRQRMFERFFVVGIPAGDNRASMLAQTCPAAASEALRAASEATGGSMSGGSGSGGGGVSTAATPAAVFFGGRRASGGGGGVGRRESSAGGFSSSLSQQSLLLRSQPMLPPKVLFSYPPPPPRPEDEDPSSPSPSTTTAASPPEEEVASFCFPEGGVPLTGIRRSASDSDLQALVYSPTSSSRAGPTTAGASPPSSPSAIAPTDNSSFVFLVRTEEGDPLWGVCFLSDDLVARETTLSRDSRGTSAERRIDGAGGRTTGGAGAFSLPRDARVAASPRCYCLLSRLPLFEAHLSFLRSVAGLERLDRVRAWLAGSGISPAAAVSFPPARPPPAAAVGGDDDASASASALRDASERMLEAAAASAAAAAAAASDDGEDGSGGDSSDDDGSFVSAESAVAPSSASPGVAPSPASPGVAPSPASPAVAREALAPEGGGAGTKDKRKKAWSRLAVTEGLGGLSLEARGERDEGRRGPAADAPPTPPPVPPRPPTSLSLLEAYYSFSPPDPGTSATFAPFPGGGSPGDAALASIEVSRPRSDDGASAAEGSEGSGEKRRGHLPLLRSLVAPPQVRGAGSRGSADSGRHGGADAGVATDDDHDEPSSLFPPPPPPPLDEEALSLRWAVALLARLLSLDDLLTLLTAALLERKMVFFHPDRGVVSGCVLALSPLLRPFRWQCPMIPLLPRKTRSSGARSSGGGGGGRDGGAVVAGDDEGDDEEESALRWLEAPVPYALGLTRKTRAAADASRAAGALRVNLYKGGLGGAGASLAGGDGASATTAPPATPRIPGRDSLAAAALRHHASLQRLDSSPSPADAGTADGGTLASLSSAEAAAVDGLLLAVRSHLALELLAPVREHALTEVDAAGERVSVLLYDTYVASFAEGQGQDRSRRRRPGGKGGSNGSSGAPVSPAVAAGERAFASALVETQMFGAMVDEILGD